MKKIIEWLLYIEEWASRIYEETAILFEDDENIYNFTNRLASDEAMHFHFMNSALNCLENETNSNADIMLDDQTINKVEGPLKRVESSIRSGKLEKTLVLESILESEHSEWNDIFLYVINALKAQCPRLKYIPPGLQNHLRVVEGFFSSVPDGDRLVSSLKRFPPVWEEKILIVDDSEPIRDLLQAVFSKEGEVHTAQNGQEAINKMATDYYAAIISDIDMPKMNGIQFYENIKRTYSDINKRVIFTSGNADNNTVRFLKKEKLVFLEKPFTLEGMREQVHKIMDQNTL